MKKAVSKFWMEIIMGAVVVAILLTIIMFFASSVSSGMEDTANSNAFQSFAQVMAKAMNEGQDTVNSWKLSTGVDDRVYAITYITHGTAAAIETVVKDPVSKLNIAKCTAEASQYSDLCLCLIRVTYANSCDNLKFNLIYLPTTVHNDPATIDAAMTEFQTKLAWVLTSDKVEDVAVTKCYLVKTELGCVYQNPVAGSSKLPCYLFYNISSDKPRLVAWLAAEKGKALEFESLIMERAPTAGGSPGYAVLIKPYKDPETLLNSVENIKCVGVRYPCGNGCSTECSVPSVSSLISPCKFG